ncbi:uncharacterized protein LOC120013448 [Tripterygium wilfordii]|uniref:uncharacterized protein LOC120013448 n=1 Tax=Tripterygium wilfordii TaxID=458696 RepID=UPI0018F81D28|nr:uncharacterized protein LOC120013448 [Tripterygium wilfordii]
MDSIYFDMVLHHGGKLAKNNISQKIEYVGGDVSCWENCNSDMFSLFEILKCLREVGYNSLKNCSFLLPNKSFEDGLKPIRNDQDVLHMIECIKGEDHVDVYVEHPVEVPIFYDGPIPDPKAVIDVDIDVEELTDSEHYVEVETDEEENESYEQDDEGGQQDDEGGQQENDDGQQENEDEVVMEDDSDSDYAKDLLNEYDCDHLEDLDYHLPIDSDDSEVEQRSKRRVPRGPVHNPNLPMKEVRLELGMQFNSLKEFKIAVKDYAIAGGFQLKYYVNNKDRCQMKCEGKVDCPWKIWCSQIKGEQTFQIKTLVESHSCTRLFVNKQASTNWLAFRIADKIRLEPDIKLIDLIPWVSENLQLDITISQAYRAKLKAKEMIEGTAKEQYARLRDYCAEIRNKNVGSTCIVHVNRVTADSPPQFNRIYICLDALKRGFLDGCRPLIGLDGCFLKGCYKGQLLTAIGQDGDGHIYPIAWAVVLVENTENWRWFLMHLMGDLGMDREWTFISDQQKGLENVFNIVLTGFEHRICARHLYNNFSKEHKGVQLKSQFYKIIARTTIPEFEHEMCVMKTLSEPAWKWLDDRADKLWSRAKIRTTCKNDMLLNNISESYNGSILKHRGKPIITFLEELRKDAMKRIVKLRKDMLDSNSNSPLVPNVAKRIVKLVDLSGRWEVIWSGDNAHSLFEVTCRPEKYVVHIVERTCSCRVWDLTGIPCCHAIAALRYIGHPIVEYVSHYYTKETYLRGYSHFVHPLNDMNMYPNTHAEAVLPPPPRKKMGRPQVKRRREAGESQDPSRLRRAYPVIKCGKCGQPGHNRRGCRSDGAAGMVGGNPNMAGTSTAASTRPVRSGVRGGSSRGGGVRRGGSRGGGVPRRGGIRRRGVVPMRVGSNLTSDTVGAATSSTRVASILQASQESVCTNGDRN